MSTIQQKKSDKQKGNCQFKLKNYHSAIQHYKMYVSQEHDDNNQALINIALCHYKLEEYQTAISYCDEALSRDQNYLKAYYRRAMCRKEIVQREKQNYVEKYRLALDCKIFCKLCNATEFGKEMEELSALGRANMQQIKLSHPQQIRDLQRGILQIQKDNIEASALSWLKSHKRCNQASLKYQINESYRIIAALEKQKVVNFEKVEQERNKIKQVKKTIIKIKEAVLEQQRINQVNTTQVQQKDIGQNRSIPEQKVEEASLDILAQPLPRIQVDNTQNQSPNLQQAQSQQKNHQLASSIITQPQVKSQIGVNQNIEVQNQFQEQKKQEKKEQLGANQIVGTVDEIFQKYFKEELSNSRDVFNSFGNNLVLVLKSIADTGKKQSILTKIAKEVPNFRLTFKGLNKQQKQKVKESIRKESIKEQIKKLYDI